MTKNINGRGYPYSLHVICPHIRVLYLNPFNAGLHVPAFLQEVIDICGVFFQCRTVYCIVYSLCVCVTQLVQSLHSEHDSNTQDIA